jgi:hypothetical protein
MTDAPISVIDPLEIPTGHRCKLGELTDELARHAVDGETGDRLAARARESLKRLLHSVEFERCCVPTYLALAPVEFERELQLPIASNDAGSLDTRVLLWPVGAKDRDHPHRDGWAVFGVVRGRLMVSEELDGERQPARAPDRSVPEVLLPRDGVRHHIHNRGDDVGLSVHIFGS